MENNGEYIIKVPINGDEVLKAIEAAGYSIHSISKEIGFEDIMLRTYLKRNEMPVVMRNAIENAIGDNLLFPGYKYTEKFNDLMGSIKAKDDKVNHPSHYTFGEIEVIDYIRDKMTPDEFQGYCMGNILKYISRHKHKNGVEDLKKARVYLGWLIESEEHLRKNSNADNEKEGV